MLQLLTPTGGRPIAWAFAERWAATQTYQGPVRWIIVDDGPVAQPISFARPGWTLEVLRPMPRWRAGENTQARNLLRGLEVCDPARPIICWEDDDYYAPGWLDRITRELEAAELVGSSRIIYYNLATCRWRQMANTNHAAMSCTAFRGRALESLRDVLTHQRTYLDAQLWRTHSSRRLFEAADVISIKGLPGRPGIGYGHNPKFGTERDEDGQVLRRLVGDEASRLYIEVVSDTRAA